MKKLLIASIAFLTVATASAQSEKYLAAMKPLVAALDSSFNYDALVASANSFQRIADAEKTQWLPYYYAAYCNVAAAFTLMEKPDASKTDPMADKAEELLNKAEALSKDNSEIYCVRKQIASIRMMADPMSRYMTYGTAATQALARAKTLDPENPRVYLLEAQDQFYTPEQYGGSKTEAKRLFELSKAKYDAARPASDIHPRWGKNQITYFMSQF
ncbi:MAG: hypothetical protein EOO09_05540 [Chitinophagaceae bacterium]|nr:MAG: hypothetical protein EOO09_05540 [Chitinophagaceae bacterium]